MKSARILLASAACALLAACGVDAPTAPATLDRAVPSTDTSTGCPGQLVPVTNPDGTVTMRCVEIEGSQIGTGS